MATNDTQTLYHYTTMSVLCSLLNNIEHLPSNNENDLAAYKLKFWISDTEYMNDPSESDFFLNSIGNAFIHYEEKYKLKEKSHIFINSFSIWEQLEGHKYILSLSESKDSLSMWRAYGSNGQGIAIGFNKERLQNFCQNTPKQKLVKIQYVDIIEHILSFPDTELKKLYDSITIGKDKASADMNIFLELTETRRLCYKNKAYSDEKEWRLVSICSGECEYRERNGLIIPYCEIKIPLDLINCIIIGPCVKSELSKRTLTDMIYNKVHGTGNVSEKIKIINSEIPYVIR